MTRIVSRLTNPDSQSPDARGELALLRQIRQRAESGRGRAGFSGLRLGIGDDCALLTVKDEELAVTTDLSIAGRHFRLDWHPAESVGHRALARGLSDLAAMGARPVAAFLSLGLPKELIKGKGRVRPWADGFLEGLLALAAAHKTPLAGGDLAESPIAVADIVLVGAVQRDKALLRSGAKTGDSLYVTGALGGSAHGLNLLDEMAAKRPGGGRPPKIPRKLQHTLAPHLFPQPRIAQGLALVRWGLATAALDLSDGLSTDLTHLCEESGVAAEVDATALPISPGATLDQALHGGEDYELLFTASGSVRLPRSISGVPITKIGRIVTSHAGKPLITLLTGEGAEPLETRGWEHFS